MSANSSNKESSAAQLPKEDIFYSYLFFTHTFLWMTGCSPRMKGTRGFTFAQEYGALRVINSLLYSFATLSVFVIGILGVMVSQPFRVFAWYDILIKHSCSVILICLLTCYRREITGRARSAFHLLPGGLMSNSTSRSSTNASSPWIRNSLYYIDRFIVAPFFFLWVGGIAYYFWYYMAKRTSELIKYRFLTMRNPHTYRDIYNAAIFVTGELLGSTLLMSVKVYVGMIHVVMITLGKHISQVLSSSEVSLEEKKVTIKRFSEYFRIRHDFVMRTQAICSIVTIYPLVSRTVYMIEVLIYGVRADESTLMDIPGEAGWNWLVLVVMYFLIGKSKESFEECKFQALRVLVTKGQSGSDQKATEVQTTNTNNNNNSKNKCKKDNKMSRKENALYFKVSTEDVTRSYLFDIKHAALEIRASLLFTIVAVVLLQHVLFSCLANFNETIASIFFDEDVVVPERELSA